MKIKHHPPRRSLLVLAALMLASSTAVLYLTTHYRAKEKILFAPRSSPGKNLSLKAYPRAIAVQVVSDVAPPLADGQAFTLSLTGATDAPGNQLQIRWVVPPEVEVMGDLQAPSLKLRNATDGLNHQIHVEVFQIKGGGKQGATAQFDTLPDTTFRRASRAFNKKQDTLEY